LKRRIDVEGCNNLRDLGGYPTEDGGRVRWRTLFRADALHHLSVSGVATLSEELRIGDVVDLRSSAEVALDGRGPLEGESVRFHHHPLFDGDVSPADRERAFGLSLGDMYYGMLDRARGPIARVLETLAGAEAPAVFHCTAGKDRTGVVSAVILGLLGVRDEVIVADYAASREALDAIVERLMSSEGYRDMWSHLPPDTLHADPETMASLLARVRAEFGSMRDYARAIGVADADVDRLARRLLEQ
jgi:protein-tyrosine phosphatase